MKSESQIQKEIIDYLKSINCYVVKIVRANAKGVPDIIACYKGVLIAIEVKAKGKKNNVTELQKLHLGMINASGGTAIVSDDVEEVMRVFK